MLNNLKIGLSGASGFIGKGLAPRLGEGLVKVFGRSLIDGEFDFIRWDFNSTEDIVPHLQSLDVFIHLAGLSAAPSSSVCPSSDLKIANVDASLSLARQCACAGVKRFIYISSIKVNGEETPLDHPFTEDDVPAPEDAYGLSKLEAEKGLLQIAAETKMDVVIIRPPIVYGFGVKGNFSTLTKIVKKNIFTLCKKI